VDAGRNSCAIELTTSRHRRILRQRSAGVRGLVDAASRIVGEGTKLARWDFIMSGQYVHMLIVNELNVTRLQGLHGFPPLAIAALLKYQRYAELGAISPDYAFFYPLQKAWSDTMHRKNVAAMLHAGIARVAAMTGDPERQHKCFAWLCGYAAHVATDVTIHPVIQLKANSDSGIHRRMEMHQDVRGWQRLGLDDIGVADHFTSLDGCYSGIHLDPDVELVWSSMLEDAYPDEWDDDPPQFALWHQAFKLVIGKIVTQGRAIPFGRHLWIDLGALYPPANQIDPQYIENLAVPVGGPQHFDQIFERAVASTARMWIPIARAVYLGDQGYLTEIGSMNLDTGRDDAGNLVFWRAS
jgi:hypothetical protein